MSGLPSFSAIILIVANLLFGWVGYYSVLGASFTSATTVTTTATAAATATGVEPARRFSRVRDATSQAAFRITPPVLVDGKVSWGLG